MYKSFAVFSVALVACVTFINNAEAKIIERIAAIAGDDIITLNDIRKEGVLRYAVKGKDIHDIDSASNHDEEMEKITKELVQSRLISRRARKNNISVGDREVDAQLQQMYAHSGQPEEAYKQMMASENIEWDEYRAYLRGEIETQYVIRSELAGQVSPSEADIIACAQEIAPNAESSINATLRQIIIPEISQDSSAGLAAESAKNLNAVWWNSLDKAQQIFANGVHELAKQSPNKFIDYVKMYSTGRSVEREGLLGTFSPRDLSKDFASVFTVNAGEIAPLITSGVGYHIVKIDEITQGESEDWKKATNQCREQITMRETQRLIESWVTDLLEKNYVSILVNRDIRE